MSDRRPDNLANISTERVLKAARLDSRLFGSASIPVNYQEIARQCCYFLCGRFPAKGR